MHTALIIVWLLAIPPIVFLALIKIRMIRLRKAFEASIDAKRVTIGDDTIDIKDGLETETIVGQSPQGMFVFLLKVDPRTDAAECQLTLEGTYYTVKGLALSASTDPLARICAKLRRLCIPHTRGST